MSSNKKVIIGTAAVLVLFVAFIVGVRVLPRISDAWAKAPAAPKVAARPAPEPIEPPLLKEADLIGSVWNVTIKGFTLKVSLNADGKAEAGSDNLLLRQMVKAKYGLESLPGKWRVDGPKLRVTTSFEGKEYSTALTISGTRLVSQEGVPIARVK